MIDFLKNRSFPVYKRPQKRFMFVVEDTVLKTIIFWFIILFGLTIHAPRIWHPFDNWKYWANMLHGGFMPKRTKQIRYIFSAKKVNSSIITNIVICLYSFTQGIVIYNAKRTRWWIILYYLTPVSRTLLKIVLDGNTNTVIFPE